MQRTLKAIAFTTLSTVGLLPILASAQSALAGTATNPVPVRALVEAKCAITTTEVNFGTYDPTAAVDKTGTGSVVITCTKGAIAKVSLDKGTNGADISNRAMKDTLSGDTLKYQLYKPDSVGSTSNASTAVWGDELGTNTLDLAAALNALPRTYLIHGVAPTAQSVGPGSYLDTVNATVNF